MSQTLEQKRNAFKQFFLNTEAGSDFMQSLNDLIDSNTDKARDTNSLDYLSRSKGNQEALELITNVLNTEVIPKE